jgi:hypothetical protein
MPNDNPEDQDSWTLEDQKQLARLRERRKNPHQNTPLRDVLQMMYRERQSEDYHIDNGGDEYSQWKLFTGEIDGESDPDGMNPLCARLKEMISADAETEE